MTREVLWDIDMLRRSVDQDCLFYVFLEENRILTFADAVQLGWLLIVGVLLWQRANFMLGGNPAMD